MRGRTRMLACTEIHRQASHGEAQNVDLVEFERILAAGAKQAGRQVRIFETHGAAPDHPLPAGFSEGQYLKVILAYVD